MEYAVVEELGRLEFSAARLDRGRISAVMDRKRSRLMSFVNMDTRMNKMYKPTIGTLSFCSHRAAPYLLYGDTQHSNKVNHKAD